MVYPNPAPPPSRDTAGRPTLLVSFGAAVVLIVLVLIAGVRVAGRIVDRPVPVAAEFQPSEAAAHPSFLYGRVTTVGGTTYEGRLRFGDGEEALWGHYFNGVKRDNPWVNSIPAGQLPTEARSVVLFGHRFYHRERPVNLSRPFMARFGDIARIEAVGDGVRAALEHGFGYDPDLRVTLKSGAVFDLARFEADDFADGVRVWDAQHGVVDLPEHRIRTIDFLPAVQRGAVPGQLYGTVHTRVGSFTGLLQWDREETLTQDRLEGQTADGPFSVRFDSILSISRSSAEGSLVTLLDGREVELSGTRETGHGHRGIYVDDPRYGRVLVSWDVFERADFSSGDEGPAYGDFPAGGALSGSVTTRTGRTLSGRLVFDLDESEYTETLDAPSKGVDYTIPFGLVASVVLPAKDPVRVTLHHGERLLLERSGDLGDGNAGLLVFTEGQGHPEYLPWASVASIAFDRPPSMYPPVATH